MRFLFISLLFFSLSSCGDRIEFSYEDAKSSEIEFFFENSKMSNFTHDLDSSTLEGSFVASDPRKYLNALDSISIRREWTKIFDETDRKIFLKKQDNTRLVCMISVSNNKVNLKMENF